MQYHKELVEDIYDLEYVSVEEQKIKLVDTIDDKRRKLLIHIFSENMMIDIFENVKQKLSNNTDKPFVLHLLEYIQIDIEKNSKQPEELNKEILFFKYMHFYICISRNIHSQQLEYKKYSFDLRSKAKFSIFL